MVSEVSDPDPNVLTVFEALGHPLRLRMVEMMAAVDELACTTLEAELPISKSTISYHVKILSEAGFIDVRRDGRWFNYRLRREELRDRLGQFAQSLDESRSRRETAPSVPADRSGG